VLLLLASTEGILIGDFEIARTVVELIEVLAVAVIAMGVVFALVAATQQWFRSSSDEAFSEFKRYMARGLLVGLDLLIAADVIKTVTLEATLENAMVLAILVLIRTFLSWTLVLEVEGQWPWQTSLTNKPPSVNE
jgi:uncharacterized membrane protein